MDAADRLFIRRALRGTLFTAVAIALYAAFSWVASFGVVQPTVARALLGAADWLPERGLSPFAAGVILAVLDTAARLAAMGLGFVVAYLAIVRPNSGSDAARLAALIVAVTAGELTSATDIGAALDPGVRSGANLTTSVLLAGLVIFVVVAIVRTVFSSASASLRGHIEQRHQPDSREVD